MFFLETSVFLVYIRFDADNKLTHDKKKAISMGLGKLDKHNFKSEFKNVAKKNFKSFMVM